MRRFLHISSAGCVITYDTFRPDIDLKTGYRNSYIPDKSLFLSVVNLDGKSNWQRYCESESKLMDEWTHPNVVYSFFDIDLERQNIYVIDSEKELYEFFSSYGVPVKKPFDEHLIQRYKKDCELANDCKLKISMIRDFFENMNDDDKSYIQQHQNEIDTKVFHISEHTKFRENIIIDGRIIVGAKGISVNFASKLYSYQSYLISTRDSAIDRQNEYIKKYDLFVKSPEYRTVDYKKVRDAGYNGVYFTQNLYVNRHLYVNVYLVSFLSWLCCDTLIIWSFGGIRE